MTNFKINPNKFFIFFVQTYFLFGYSAINAQTKKPNVMVILTDDMGYSDIGCFGSEIRTPNIDRLAANGLRFTSFYNTARCSPTRASLLTGLYPHQAGMGHLSTESYTEEGYTDNLSKNAVTMAELFKKAGYATYMTGKWHIAKDMKPNGDKSNWPLQRGFQRYFGTLNGSGSYYDPGTLISNNTFVAPYKDFYYTRAITDTTVKFIQEHPKQQPFFFYVAYTAAHWPLHAPENDVKKYKGVYDKGWDVMREQRFNKLKKLGIISDKCVLTDRGVDVPAWKDEPLKDWQVKRMEVYAAMVDIMDEGIGKIITALEKKGELENTIIFYMHDNGGCAEPVETDKPAIPLTELQKVLKPMPQEAIFLDKKPEYTRDGRFVQSGRGVMPGDANSWSTYGEEWANVSNTPFRSYKQYTHEGGIASPLIVHWPKGIAAKGQLRTQPSHLIDIMATCLAITALAYPKQFNGYEIQALEGKNLVPAFTNKPIARDFIFWEHSANRAIRIGDWKLVSRTGKQKTFGEADENKWELYDLKNDPTERINLATKYPDKTKEMAQKWEAEAIRTKAKPWPWKPAK
jgi:arylsulfatase A-like enzyme